jgi:hypothetical protein
MPTIAPDTSDAVEIAELLGCRRDWTDLEHDQLGPLLVKHDDDLTGLRVGLYRIASLLTHTDDEPQF